MPGACGKGRKTQDARPKTMLPHLRLADIWRTLRVVPLRHTPATRLLAPPKTPPCLCVSACSVFPGRRPRPRFASVYRVTPFLTVSARKGHNHAHTAIKNANLPQNASRCRARAVKDARPKTQDPRRCCHAFALRISGARQGSCHPATPRFAYVRRIQMGVRPRHIPLRACLATVLCLESCVLASPRHAPLRYHWPLPKLLRASASSVFTGRRPEEPGGARRGGRGNPRAGGS